MPRRRAPQTARGLHARARRYEAEVTTDMKNAREARALGYPDLARTWVAFARSAARLARHYRQMARLAARRERLDAIRAATRRASIASITITTTDSTPDRRPTWLA